MVLQYIITLVLYILFYWFIKSFWLLKSDTINEINSYMANGFTKETKMTKQLIEKVNANLGYKVGDKYNSPVKLPLYNYILIGITLLIPWINVMLLLFYFGIVIKKLNKLEPININYQWRRSNSKEMIYDKYVFVPHNKVILWLHNIYSKLKNIIDILKKEI